MLEVGTYEAKTRFSELLERAERGETILITRHGKPVARLVGDRAERRERAAQVVEEIRKLRSRAQNVPIAEIIEMKNEGRRY
jgi:prevent-host-death family protein